MAALIVRKHTSYTTTQLAAQLMKDYSTGLQGQQPSFYLASGQAHYLILDIILMDTIYDDHFCWGRTLVSAWVHSRYLPTSCLHFAVYIGVTAWQAIVIKAKLPPQRCCTASKKRARSLILPPAEGAAHTRRAPLFA